MAEKVFLKRSKRKKNVTMVTELKNDLNKLDFFYLL